MTLSSKKLLTSTSQVQAVSWRDSKVIILDQTALPKKECYVECLSTAQLIEAIQRLAVRGAPALGVAGAYGVVLATLEVQSQPEKNRWNELNSKIKSLALARPTAVNLSWAINQLKPTLQSWNSQGKAPDKNLAQLLLAQAQKIHEDDIESNRTLSELGGTLLEKGAVLTVCNTGALATGGIGTAFGVLTHGFRLGKVSHVFACETRPLLQGSRLTTWELNQNQIPFTLVCDNMAASLMRREKLSAVLVGADRIAANGDVANKIGTYSLAVLAKAHSVPFYVAAPSSTFDLSLDSGDSIPIEERSHEEVLSILGENRPPFPIPVWNPAFDVTPHALISAIICERGVIKSPSRERIEKLFSGSLL